MARYASKASDKVGEALHERKTGELRSGSSGKKVTSRKQAIAIGLSAARREGDKVPPKKKAPAERAAAARKSSSRSKSESRKTAKAR